MRTDGLKEALRRWAAELVDSGTTEYRKRQIQEWSAGVSIAMTYLGYDDLAEIADDIWAFSRQEESE